MKNRLISSVFGDTAAGPSGNLSERLIADNVSRSTAGGGGEVIGSMPQRAQNAASLSAAVRGVMEENVAEDVAWYGSESAKRASWRRLRVVLLMKGLCEVMATGPPPTWTSGGGVSEIRQRSQRGCAYHMPLLDAHVARADLHSEAVKPKNHAPRQAGDAAPRRRCRGVLPDGTGEAGRRGRCNGYGRWRGREIGSRQRRDVHTRDVGRVFVTGLIMIAIVIVIGGGGGGGRRGGVVVLDRDSTELNQPVLRRTRRSVLEGGELGLCILQPC